MKPERKCPVLHDGRPCLRPVVPDSSNGTKHALCIEDELAALRNAYRVVA